MYSGASTALWPLVLAFGFNSPYCRGLLYHVFGLAPLDLVLIVVLLQRWVVPRR